MASAAAAAVPDDNVGGAGVDAAVKQLTVFLEACVHQILYARGVYPAEIFERRKLLGVPVMQSRHPDLNEYIVQVLRSLEPLIARTEVEEVAVVIRDAHETPCERFSFHVCGLGPSEEQGGGATAADGDAEDLDAVQAGLRELLRKVCTADSALEPLPDGCTFIVVAVSTEVPPELRDRWESVGPSKAHAVEGAPPRVVGLKTAAVGNRIVAVNVTTRQEKAAAIDADMPS